MHTAWSKWRKPLREVLARPYASEGFAYQTRADKAITKIAKESFQNFEFRQTEVWEPLPGRNSGVTIEC